MVEVVEFRAVPARDTLRKMSGLKIITTDLPMSSFPDYIDPFESSGETMTGSPMTAPSAASRLASKLMKDDPTRHPSPQPTHFSVNSPYLSKANGNGHRVLRSATVGYVAPEFTGKADQMKEGESP